MIYIIKVYKLVTKAFPYMLNLQLACHMTQSMK